MANKTMNIIMALKDQISQPLKKVSKEITEANKKVVQSQNKIKQLSSVKNKYTNKLKEEEKRLKTLNRSTSKNKEEIAKAEAAIAGYKKAIEDTAGKISVLRKKTDEYNKELTKLKKKQSEVEKGFKKMTTGAIRAIDSLIGRTLQLGIAIATVAAVVGFAGLVELDEGARKVKSIAGESLKLQEIRESLLQQSKATGIRMEELAETQYSAISAGVAAADSAMASVKATKLAIAGFTDSNSALKIMTATMNVYGLTGQAAMDKIADKLMVTQNLGVTTVAELSNSMGSLTPVANSANVSLDELMGGMAALTKNGLKTEEAVTTYKAILSSVIKPSKEAADKAKELGINFSTAAIKSKGMAGFLEDIKKKTGGSTDELSKLFGGVEALSGALILTGKGLHDFKVSTEAMGKSAGTTDAAYQIMSNSIGRRINKLKNTFQVIMTSVLDSQSGLIGEQIDNISKWLSANDKAIQDSVKRIGDILGRFFIIVKGIFDFINKYRSIIELFLVFGATIYAVVKAYKAWKTIMIAVNVIQGLFNKTLAFTPLGQVAIIIGIVVTALYLLWKHWDIVTQAVKNAWIWIKEFIGRLTHVSIALLWPIAPILLLIKHFETIKSVAGSVFDFMKRVIKGFVSIVSEIGNALIEPFRGFFSYIFEKLKALGEIAGKGLDFVKRIFIKESVEDSEREKNQKPTNNGVYGSYHSMKKYAQGGIADKPSIFGEAGPEIAIPLNNNPRSKALLNEASKAVGGGSGVTVIIKGDVYGFDDFREKVAEAVVKIYEQVGPNVVGGM